MPKKSSDVTSSEQIAKILLLIYHDAKTMKVFSKLEMVLQGQIRQEISHSVRTLVKVNFKNVKVLEMSKTMQIKNRYLNFSYKHFMKGIIKHD